MRDALLRWYHRLPPSLRSVVATARGGYLRSWRYGPAADRLADEAQARDRWSADQWRRWQEERLAFVLHRAATRVPFYREQWAERRRRGDRAAWDVLANWPILDKDTLRADARRFVTDDLDPDRMFHEHTSGTTGKSLDLWLARSSVREWYALYEVRARRWYGVSRHERWAIIGGQLVAPAAQDDPPFWVWNAALKQLYLSAYHLAPRHARSYVDALTRYRVRHLLGYPSALHALAREVLAQSLTPPPIAVVVTNAEPLLAHQRETIGEAFRCPVRETYGMAEMVAAGSECEHEKLHVWPEAGWIEVDGAPHGETGDLICTSLLNADMPLVRYRLGDRGALAGAGASCACGRTLPILAGIEGRSDDVLYTVDGRVVGRLDPVFKAGSALREAQLVQEALDRVHVRYVPDAGFGDADRESLIRRLRDRMGPVSVTFEEMQAIPRTNNGKFRAVICRLSAEERRRVGAG